MNIQVFSWIDNIFKRRLFGCSMNKLLTHSVWIFKQNNKIKSIINHIFQRALVIGNIASKDKKNIFSDIYSRYGRKTSTLKVLVSTVSSLNKIKCNQKQTFVNVLSLLYFNKEFERIQYSVLCFNYPAATEKLICTSIYIQSTYLSMYFMTINVFLMREECRSDETVSGRFTCPTVFPKFWETVTGDSSINTSIVIRTWKVTPFWKQNGKGSYQNLIIIYKPLYLYSDRLPIHIPTHDRGQKPN